MLASRLTLLFLIAACGGKTIANEDGGTTDGAPKSDAIAIDVAPPPNDSSIDCNSVDPGNLLVTVVDSSGSPPPLASTGDTIQPGLWVLDELNAYGVSGQVTTVTAQMRVNITNNGYLFQIGSISDNQAPSHSNESAQDFGSGTLGITETCPGSQMQYKAIYVAEPQTLTIRLFVQGVTIDESFKLIGP